MRSIYRIAEELRVSHFRKEFHFYFLGRCLLFMDDNLSTAAESRGTTFLHSTSFLHL